MNAPLSTVDVPLECAGCGAYPHELCVCRARDDRQPTAHELELARDERLTRAERPRGESP